jgi:hypothetical protein
MGSPIRKLSSRPSPWAFIDQCDEEGKPSPVLNPFLPFLSFPAFLLKESVSWALAARQMTQQARPSPMCPVRHQFILLCLSVSTGRQEKKGKERQEDRQFEAAA